MISPFNNFESLQPTRTAAVLEAFFGDKNVSPSVTNPGSAGMACILVILRMMCLWGAPLCGFLLHLFVHKYLQYLCPNGLRSHLYIASPETLIFHFSSFILPAMPSGDWFCLNSETMCFRNSGCISIFIPWYFEFDRFIEALCSAAVAQYIPSSFFLVCISLDTVLLCTPRTSAISFCSCPARNKTSILSRA